MTRVAAYSGLCARCGERIEGRADARAGASVPVRGRGEKALCTMCWADSLTEGGDNANQIEKKEALQINRRISAQILSR